MLQSRKFKLALFNALVAILFLLVGQFAPQYADLVKALVVAIEAPLLMLILGIAIEDAGQKASGESWQDKAERNQDL